MDLRGKFLHDTTFQFADNEDLQTQWRAAKRSNKMKVVRFLKEKTGYAVSTDAMFDIQVIFWSLSSFLILFSNS